MISSQARSRHNGDLPSILTHLLVHWQIICRVRISLRLYHRAGSCRLGPPGQAGTNHYAYRHPGPRSSLCLYPLFCWRSVHLPSKTPSTNCTRIIQRLSMSNTYPARLSRSCWPTTTPPSGLPRPTRPWPWPLPRPRHPAAVLRPRPSKGPRHLLRMQAKPSSGSLGYVTYILCYIPPLLPNKTMQHI